jgi:membrane-associated phospholipid phosphatase
MIWDMISLLVYALGSYPFIRLFDTLDIVYLYVIVGYVMCLVFIKLTRMIPVSYCHKIMLRPPNASNCSIFNQGGACGGRIGMPSGHVLLATYVVSILLFLDKTHNIYKQFIGASVIAMIALSRIMKGCHTILQTIVGGLLGFGFAYATFLVISKN